MNKQFNPKTGSRGIEWADETRNAIGGCLHGCEWEMPDGTRAVCYAKEVAEGVAQKSYPHGFEHHYFNAKALSQLSAGKEPRLIFCDSMSDLFAANVPPGDVRAVLAEMWKAPHHAYQSLTKAAPSLLKYTDAMPPNLWVGVSSPPDWFMGNRLSPDQQQRMLRKSLEVLAEVKRRTGNIAWMSAEPVSWDMAEIIADVGSPLDWIVIGAASSGKRYFQPDPEHIRRLLNVMDETVTSHGVSTPVFYKGNIRPMFAEHDLGSDRLNRWREDFPTTYRDGTPIPAVVARQQACEVRGWTRSIALPVLGA